MSIYNKILVVADVNSDQQPALARAIQLSESSRSESHITFFLSIYDFSYEMTSMLSVDERDAMRRGVIQQREAWMEEVASMNPLNWTLRWFGIIAPMKPSSVKCLQASMKS